VQPFAYYNSFNTGAFAAASVILNEFLDFFKRILKQKKVSVKLLLENEEIELFSIFYV
jgi:hypothetical protein